MSQSQVVRCKPLSPELRKQRMVHLCEFETSLGYIAIPHLIKPRINKETNQWIQIYVNNFINVEYFLSSRHPDRLVELDLCIAWPL